MVLNLVWKLSPESLQNTPSTWAGQMPTLDQEQGRAEPAGTSQSLLPPGGILGNSLACDQRLHRQAYSTTGPGDTGGPHPPLLAPSLSGYSMQLRDEFNREKSQHKTTTDGGTVPVPWCPQLDHRTIVPLAVVLRIP